MSALPTSWCRVPFILVLASGPVWIALGGCGRDAGTSPNNEGNADSIPVAGSIEMLPESQLYVDSLGATRVTGAVAYAKDGAQLYGSWQKPARFSWTSSSANVARVDQNGVITGLGWGTATITATHRGATGSLRVVVGDAVHLGWSVPTAERARAGIAVGSDGAIYVASRDRLSVVSPKGNLIWSIPTSSTVGIPAIGADGTLYFGNLYGGLAAVGPGGTIQWGLTDLGIISSSVALGPDGTVYAASEDSLVYAVNPGGKVKWTYRGTDRFFQSSPAVASDGTIYVGSDDGVLHAIKPDGTRRWIFKAARIQSSPSIGNDGIIYFGAFDARLHALNPDGTERWSTAQLGSTLGTTPFYGSPAIATDGTIYVSRQGLFAINPDGTVRWSSVTNGNINADPVLGADGSVYAGNPQGVVYAFDAHGMLQWTYAVARPYPAGYFFGSPAIGFDGTIYAASDDGTLWALVEKDSKNGGYAGSPWPKVRGNRANTGRAGAG